MNLAGNERERKDASSMDVAQSAATAKWHVCWLRYTMSFGRNYRYGNTPVMQRPMLRSGNTTSPNHHSVLARHCRMSRVDFGNRN
jgi:hypothetical protein